MQQERTSSYSQDELERDVLYALTADGEPVWSVEDLGRAMSDPAGAVNAVAGLLAAGLIHQTSDGFVFATHAGYRVVAMIGPAV